MVVASRFAAQRHYLLPRALPRVRARFPKLELELREEKTPRLLAQLEAELAGEDVLLLEDGHCLRNQALRICATAGAHTFERVRATSLGTLLQMVANGLGVTLVPESAIDVELRGAKGVAIRRLRAPAPGRTVGLAWRANAPREAEFGLLGDVLAETAKRSRAQTRDALRARRSASASR